MVVTLPFPDLEGEWKGVSGKERLHWDLEVCLFVSQCRAGTPVTSQNIPLSPAAAEGGAGDCCVDDVPGWVSGWGGNVPSSPSPRMCSRLLVSPDRRDLRFSAQRSGDQVPDELHRMPEEDALQLQRSGAQR